MTKNSIIILTVVVTICALGLLAASVFNWSVDSDSTSGNVAKSSRFMRKTATEGITNMEELLRSDESYKDGLVAAYMVMQTRTAHFGTLVDLSNQAAGEIPEFEALLKDMNQTAPLVQNVCSALIQAGDNLNAILEGESCPEVGQSTLNASLAYVTLQKQNKLADRFIETTDRYLEKASGSDLLKFVRDQWAQYRLMTAALEGDAKSVAKLEKENDLLSPEGTLAILKSCEGVQQEVVIETEALSRLIGLKSGLKDVVSNLTPEGLGMSSSSFPHIPLSYNSDKIEDLMTHTSEFQALSMKFDLYLNGWFGDLDPNLGRMNELLEQAAQGDELGVINIVKLPKR